MYFCCYGGDNDDYGADDHFEDCTWKEPKKIFLGLYLGLGRTSSPNLTHTLLTGGCSSF